MSEPPQPSAAPLDGVPVAAALSEGLQGLLQPMVEKCDTGIQQAVDSQALLSKQIDRVAAELQAFLSVSQARSGRSKCARESTGRGHLLHAPPTDPLCPLIFFGRVLARARACVQLPSFAPHAHRLAEVRRRTAAASGTLQQVQARLSRIEAMADRLQQEELLQGSATPTAAAASSSSPSPSSLPLSGGGG